MARVDLLFGDPVRAIAALVLLSNFAHARPDAFTWSVLTAESEVDGEEHRGEIDEARFLRELERFPWAEQLGTPQHLQRAWPTLTLFHGGHDRYLAISGVRHAEGDGFFLFWGQGSTAADPRLVPVGERSKVRQITELFFAGEIARLDELFASHGQPMDRAFSEAIVPPQLPDLSRGP
jgi:hypothetical protein